VFAVNVISVSFETHLVSCSFPSVSGQTKTNRAAYGHVCLSICLVCWISSYYSFCFSLCLFQASGFFFFTYGSFRHLVGLLGWGISPSPRPLPTEDNTTQRNTDTHPCPEQDSNLRSQCSSGRRQYLP
jgi:hypothetical protein